MEDNVNDTLAEQSSELAKDPDVIGVAWLGDCCGPNIVAVENDFVILTL